MHTLTGSRVFRLAVSLALAAVLAFVLSTAAHSQTSDAQYGSPEGPVGGVLGTGGTGGAAGSGGAGSGVVSSGGSAIQAVAPSQGSQSLAQGGAGIGVSSGGSPITSGGSAITSGGSAITSGGAGITALLPETGGSLAFFAALLGCALVGSGLLILRRVSRQH